MNQVGDQFIEGCRLIGAGCATIGVIGAGVGIELFLEISLWLMLEIQI
jgi:hypothetical protein